MIANVENSPMLGHKIQYSHCLFPLKLHGFHHSYLPDGTEKKKKKERVLIHPVSREGEDDSQAPQEGSLLKPLEEEIKRKQMSQESYRWASTLKLYMRADFRRKVFVKAPLFCQA